MGKINYARVFLGGIAAGSVAVMVQYAAFFLGAYAKLGEAAGLPLGDPSSAAQLSVAALEILVGGPLAIWLYAAIRPRFGAGPRTALLTSVYIWLVIGPYGLTILAVSGLLVKFPSAVAALLIISTLPFVVGPMLIGAAIYQEEAAPSAAAKAAGA